MTLRFCPLLLLAPYRGGLDFGKDENCLKEGTVSVRPLHYDIHLEPDLKNFILQGEVQILIKAESPTSKIKLNGASIKIHSSSVHIDNIWQLVRFTQPTKKTESFSLTLPHPMTGQIRIRLKYSGEINDTMLGFYRSRFKTEAGEERNIAVTQFEESHARKAFPCFLWLDPVFNS